MKHAGDGPTSYRRRPSFNWLRPRGHHAFVLGVGAAVCGIVGVIRSVMEGSALLTALGWLAAAVFGLVLTVAWIVTYAKEH
ncbi:hypothetical protein ACIQMO_22690 [Streptomyces sp. NPDC091406]|uniref:hypothetical protein n=1 Tax=unclassified Streptomyces TaxID=2593676 RepID=UPI0037F7BB80